ncbi:pyridoxal phosphate phosphatase PHOSPHO2-like [Ischnura elegans]|uniref:pyridoxal phosphate phosphatase PHOSPHO2-like n=1 Tax=Ischnura elegans TaxID=197161 RepID=UPI001ED89F02|nr:pyridoxal phosphate phosphatase PHOSPHO2-like [Ischnura elegans]
MTDMRKSSESISTMRRLLAAFDFDHTIIEGNSDVVVKDLLPKEKLTEDVRKLYKSDGWTAYMRRIFQLLHESKFSQAEVLSAVRKIPFTSGMKELVKWLHDMNGEIIIISDSNSVFIDDYLRNSSIANCVTKVFTNPAVFNESACLEIEMYHYQDWCDLSTKNLCKGHILETYINERSKEGVEFPFVVYVGDGANDFCPTLRLSKQDITFPRVGYALEKKINNAQESDPSLVKASVVPWTNGLDIIDVLKEKLNVCI